MIFFSNIPKTYHDKLPKFQDDIRIKKSYNFIKHKKIVQSIFLNPTYFDEVDQIISSLKKKFSTGIDEIPPKALYYFPNRIIHCLVHIFNLSMSQGKFITSFKKAKVIPIYKKKIKSDMNNYRPISLLPVISKILEKIMHKRVHSFLAFG